MKKEKIELLARVTDTIRSIDALGFDTNDHLQKSSKLNQVLSCF
jgi:hypothetical protein